MPIVLPTPDELARMDWHKRDRAILATRRLLRAYGGVVTEDMTADNFRTSAEARQRADRAWGERVRAEARALAGEVGA